jgi:hypothetical protein
MKLFHPVRDVSADRRGPYCGPSAVAFLTGVPVSRIEKMFRRIRGGWRDELGRRKTVKGKYAG